MATNAIPSLTEAGFITNKNVQMGKLFGYFMAADYSQSTIFKDRVTSLKYILAQYTSPNGCAEAIKSELATLYGRYFDSVTVYVEQEDKGKGIVNLNIEIVCKDSEPYKEYRLSREIQTKEGNMVEFESGLDQLYNYYKGQEDYETK